MKKRHFIIPAAVIIVLALVASFFIYVGGSHITKGIYRISGNDEYPDAYIEITSDTIRFYNIDLNSIFYDYNVKMYNMLIRLESAPELSEEEFAARTDLNAKYVETSSSFDVINHKYSTFIYIYEFLDPQYMFGFLVEYDSLHKTIIMREDNVRLVFEK